MAGLILFAFSIVLLAIGCCCAGHNHGFEAGRRVERDIQLYRSIREGWGGGTPKGDGGGGC